MGKINIFEKYTNSKQHSFYPFVLTSTKYWLSWMLKTRKAAHTKVISIRWIDRIVGVFEFYRFCLKTVILTEKFYNSILTTVQFCLALGLESVIERSRIRITKCLVREPQWWVEFFVLILFQRVPVHNDSLCDWCFAWSLRLEQGVKSWKQSLVKAFEMLGRLVLSAVFREKLWEESRSLGMELG